VPLVQPIPPSAGGVTVLDGGLATQLEAQGHDLADALWSARLLVDDPGAIVAAHLAFFRAGAQVATTASYQASFPGFAARGIGRADAARLLRRSVELAGRARAAVAGDGRRRFVAASVGPYGAALADGSEYRGRYGLGVAELADWHRPRLEVLAAAGPDVLALETVPDADEARALAAAVAGLPVPAWLSYSVDGARTRAGQPLAEAFAVVADVPEIVAVGVNCCDPDDVAPALAVARQVTDKPVVVYPNSGELWDAGARRWTGPSHFTPARTSAWIAAGAFAVGGCCRVRPSDIAALAAVAAQNRALAPKCDPGAAPDRTMAPKCGSEADPPGRSCSVERRRR
jgi:homocysteine S-methyltransferase